MSEDEALFGIPYARGLQYIHCALMSNGATVRLPLQRKSLAKTMIDGHKSIQELDIINRSDD